LFTRVFELVFPTQNFRFGAEFFGGGFVAFFHPDAGERRINEQIVWTKGECTLRRAKRFVEPAQLKVNLRQGMPSSKSVRGLLDRLGQLFDGGGVVAHREVEGGVVD